MTQIVVTLEDGSNASLINEAIRMIKGVKRAVVKRVEDTGFAHSKSEDAVVKRRLEAFVESRGQSLGNYCVILPVTPVQALAQP